jgi:hypothetical protein
MVIAFAKTCRYDIENSGGNTYFLLKLHPFIELNLGHAKISQ